MWVVADIFLKNRIYQEVIFYFFTQIMEFFKVKLQLTNIYYSSIIISYEQWRQSLKKPSGKIVLYLHCMSINNIGALAVKRFN